MLSGAAAAEMFNAILGKTLDILLVSFSSFGGCFTEFEKVSLLLVNCINHAQSLLPVDISFTCEVKVI